MFQFVGIALIVTKPEPIYGTLVFLASTAMQAFYFKMEAKTELKDKSFVETTSNKMSQMERELNALKTATSFMSGLG